MQNMTRTYCKLFIVALLPLYFMLNGNSISNKHFHVLQNGLVISHAHPFNKTHHSKDGSAGHKHSKTELVLFHSFNDNHHLAAVPVSVPAPAAFAIQELVPESVRLVISEGGMFYNNRAPPVSFL